MYSLDLIIVIECRNDSITGFLLLHLYLKKNNKKKSSTFVFAFDSKRSKPNNLLKSFKIISHLK